ncbi:hypothetical protein [Tamlana crocina]|uniref:Lipoprotein n=1 Tax=Tamlana crocina TaxID=393006 RepID=A0ABX1DAG8_9FLAO|nr:hypothetical protein [Tamlana crocina]NJX14167.1 hypothetical protein [Tamlana crocina]
MKTLKIIPMLFLLLFFNCSGQEKQGSTAQNDMKPDENITVNKEYDEHGNLIKYDSIYSYSYSSNGKLNDSLRMQFENHFKQNSIFSDSFFDDFFGSDSDGTFNPRNFFQRGFINQDEHIKGMMKRMDSIQQLFFEQHARPIIPAEPQEPSPDTEKMSYNQI